MFTLQRSALLPTVLTLFILQCSNLSFAQFNGNFDIERHFLGEENFLDWRAYQQSIPMRQIWSKTKNGMRATTGSFSLEYFYLDHEIRYQSELGQYSSLIYRQEQESIVQDNSIYQEVEFRFLKGPFIGLAGYPQYQKKYFDLGFTLSEGDYFGDYYIKLSRIYQDELFNEKNVEDDKNSSQDKYITLPVFNRFQLKIDEEELFLQIDLKLVEPTEYFSHAENTYKNFSQKDVELELHWKYQMNKLVGTSIRYKNDDRFQKSGNQSTILKEQVLQLGNLDFFHHNQFTDLDFLTLGLMTSSFTNRIEAQDSKEDYLFNMDFYQIYAFWQSSYSDWLQMIYSVQMGNLLLTKNGGDIASQNNDEIQAKSGLGVIMFETDNYHLFVNTTWDLDDFLERQWDGGNVQIQVYF